MPHTKEHNKDFQDRVVGAYRRKSDAKRANKLEDNVESFDGGDFTLKSKHDPNDKRRQRAVRNQNRKDARRERRAKRIGARKLMSDEQAQDFMRNRKDRFNVAFGNVLLDLTGNEDKKKRIADRYYRKEGSGTIQNVAKLDAQGNPTGETYDATDPFQFSGTRIRATKKVTVPKRGYEIIQPKPMADLNIDIGPKKPDKIKKKDDPKKVQKKIVEEKKEEEISNMVNPQAGAPVIDTVGLPDNSFLTHTDVMGNIVTNRKNQQLNEALRRNIKLPNVAEMIRKTQEEIERNRIKNLLKK